MKELEKQQKEMEENADRQFASEIGNGILNHIKVILILSYMIHVIY